MGSNRRKRTKQCSVSDISDIDKSTQPPTTSTKGISPQHFPRFILVESKEENKPITSLSPFVIQKVIQSIAGEPENIKSSIGNGDLGHPQIGPQMGSHGDKNWQLRRDAPT